VEGYDFLVQDLEQNIRSSKQHHHIIQSSTVQSVTSADTRDITIAYAENGQTEPKAICADFVCIALPLGVLKLAADNGGVAFAPRFPERRMEAQRHMKMGSENKIILAFDTSAKPFWPTERLYLQCTDRRFRWLNLHSHKPRVLCAHFVSVGDEMEWTEAEVVAAAREVLEQMFFCQQVRSFDRVAP